MEGKKTTKKEKKEKKLSNFYIYCLTSFHSDIYKDDKFLFMVNNEEIKPINILSKTNIEKYPDYDFIIYELCFEKPIKELNLAFKCKANGKIYDLSKFIIKSEKGKFILTDNIEINQDFIPFFFSQLDKAFLEKKSFLVKYLNSGEKLNLFLQCFNQKENSDELKKLLAKQILNGLKEGEEILLSELICIFNIVFQSKIIINFLKTYPKLDIQFDEFIENEEFKKKILILYENDINLFFEKNNNFFQKSEDIRSSKNIENKDNISLVEKYKNLLEDFIIIYKSIYDDPDKIEKQKLKKIKKIFFNLIENKKDLVKISKFLDYKFDVIYKLLTLDNRERYKIKKSFLNSNLLPHILFEQFIEHYKFISQKEDKKNNFIFDFSDVFNYFADNLKELNQLISLKNSYKKELNAIPNKILEEKIIKTIHSIGFNLIQKGSRNNMQILDFLKNDEDYSRKYIDDKDFEILKFFNLELMDEKFFESYNKYEIFTYFEKDYSKYLKNFSLINDIKYLGHFFKLLPQEKYQELTANFVLEWLEKNINTYDADKYQEFISQIEIFFFILNEKSNQLLLKFLNILEVNLVEDCIKIFIDFTNKFGETINQKVADIMVNYILCGTENEKEQIIKINNIYKFLDEIKPSKLIIKVFLNNVQKMSFSQDDFYSENSPKFSLFTKLFEMNDYSLLRKIDNKNYQYWLNIKQICENIHGNLKNLNLNYFQIKRFIKIIKGKNFKQRITLVFRCLGIENSQKYAEEIFSKIKEIIDKWNINLKIIDKIRQYYVFIYEENSLIEDISNYISKINNSTLQYLSSNEASEEFSKFSRDKEKADKVAKLKECRIFVDIFNDTKLKNNSTNYIDEATKKFDNLKKIFVNDKNKIEKELKSNDEVKFLIKIGYKNEDELEKEIDWLLDYFKISDFDSKFLLIDDIKLLIKKKSIFSTLSGILKLFDIYKEKLNLINQEDLCLQEEITKNKNNLKENQDISIDEIQQININTV